MCFPTALRVEVLEIHCTIRLDDNHHFAAPGNRGFHCDWCNVTIKVSFDSSFEAMWHGIGECTALGTGLGLRGIFPSGPDKFGNGGELLKALLPNWSMMYFLSLGTFSRGRGGAGLRGIFVFMVDAVFGVVTFEDH